MIKINYIEYRLKSAICSYYVNFTKINNGYNEN